MRACLLLLLAQGAWACQGQNGSQKAVAADLVLRHERETGSIEVGKLADLIVLERNLFETPPEEIHTVRILRTLLEGETIFQY